MYRLFPLLIIGAALVGCGATDKIKKTFSGGEDNNAKPTELNDIRQRLSVVKLWDQNAGKGTDELYLKLIPTLTNGRIYGSDFKGDVICFDAVTGKRIWKTDIDENITGGTGASARVAVVGTNEGHVIAISAETGKKIWRSRVSSEVLSAPVIDEGIVVVRTIDGNIFGLDEETGKRLWIYDRTVPALTLRGTSAPVISDDMVVAGFDGGKLAALELETGKLIWETRVSMGSGRSELDRMVDIDAEPIIQDGVIYVSTFQGRISAVDLITGRLIWFRDIPSYAGLSVDSSYVYVTDDDSHIWALDKFSGNSIWKNEKLEARSATGPTVLEQFVVVGDLEGYVHWLDSNTGDFIARHQLGKDRIITHPVVSDDILYVYSSNGKLGAYTYKGALKQARPGKKYNFDEVDESGKSEDEIIMEMINQPDAPPEESNTSGKSEDEIIMEMINQQEQGTEAAPVATPPQTNYDDPDFDASAEDEEEKKGFFGRMMDIFSDDDDEEEQKQ